MLVQRGLLEGRGCPGVGVAYPIPDLEVLLNTALDTIATALNVTTDDLVKAHPEQFPTALRWGSRHRSVMRN